MKICLRCVILLAVFCMPLLSFAANPVFQSNPQEIQYLENLILQAKRSNSAIDPAWMARLQELWALEPKPLYSQPVSREGHTAAPLGSDAASIAGSQGEYERLRAELQALKARGETLDPALVERLNQLAPAPVMIESGEPFNAPVYEGAEAMRRYDDPLERQIRELENEIYCFTCTVEPPTPTQGQIERLNALYAQRPSNQRSFDRALDQGNDACPATVIGGIPYSDAGTTVGRARNFDPPCDAAGSTAPDVIYQFTPATTNRYIVTATASYNSVLSIRTTGVCPGSTQVACSNGGAVSSITLDLTTGINYWFVVGGQNASAGTYTLTVTDTCSNPCLGADVAECAEAVGDTSHGRLDCDGGCNNVIFSGVASFGSLQFGQTICGRSFTYVREGSNTRDTDFYTFIVTEPCTVKASLEAEFSAQLVYGTYVGDCFGSILLNTSNSQCRPMNLNLYFAVPDTYLVFVSPISYTGLPVARPYRLSLDCCPLSATLNAPSQVTGNTCSAPSYCPLRNGARELTYKVVIPRQSYWRFHTCSSLPTWDSYLFLTTQCCGGTTLASDDDGCGGVGFSRIDCIFLQPGTYYLTVEGFGTTSCGDFQLTVSECYGRCCYDDPGNPQCVLADTVRCTSLYGGDFLVNTTCETAPCDTTHFLCQDGAEFGQIPFLNGEAGADAYYSSIERTNLQRSYDDYSVSRPITHVRFWGTGVTTMFASCVENPLTCTISFHPDSGIFPHPNPVATYSLNLTGVFTQNLIFASTPFPCYQYDAEIWPPCSLLTGWISIYDLGVDSCFWAWQTSPHGNDTLAYRTNNNSTAIATPRDLAFCLGTYPHCGSSFDSTAPQQVTIRSIGTPVDPEILLTWVPPSSATYEIWSTIYPNNDGNPDNGNDSMWVLEARIPINAPLPPSESWVDTQATVLYKNYVITQGCRPPNDACDSPIHIGKGITPVDNRGATTDGPIPALPCRPYLDIWYVYTAPETGPDTLSFCADVGGFATWDTEVVVYNYTGSDDCPAAGGELACNDDFCSIFSRVAWNSTAGAQYLIRVGAFFASTGTGQFVIY